MLRFAATGGIEMRRGEGRELRAPRLPALWLTMCLVDAAAWIFALLVATILRYDFQVVTNSGPRLGVLMALVALAQLFVGGALGLYRGVWRLGSFEEVQAIAVAVVFVGAFATVLDLALARPMPLSAVVMSGPIAALGMACFRSLARLRRDRSIRGATEAASRVVVFGAGDAGTSAVSAMLRDPARTYLPVALLDDDPLKANLRIQGVPVRGGRAALAEIARSLEADTLLVAIPSAGADLIGDVAARAEAVGLNVLVLPPVKELFGQAVGVKDIRPISHLDLLGRREVDIDLDAISAYLAEKRVLVTGAGGSIGSELCAQLRRFPLKELVMLDRDESALHALQLALEGRALLDDPNLVVADIRDRQRLAAVFAQHQPEVVFHAAALKHLPLLESHPSEAVKTNVWGTWNVLEASTRAGVERFVNISTDKAADPTCVLGYSKRLAERLTSWFDTQSDMSCMSVRFGNVLGSRGSVLAAFQAQIADGLPVTVTHPDVTRFFMTVGEAVHLVIQAGAIGSKGEALVLDMGQPVKIAEVAQRLIDGAGSNSQITYTGMRPGEKMHEVLLAEGEPDVRDAHPYISQVPVPPLSPLDTMALVASDEPGDVIEALVAAVAAPVRLPERPAPQSAEVPGLVTGTSRVSAPTVFGRRAADPLTAS